VVTGRDDFHTAGEQCIYGRGRQSRPVRAVFAVGNYEIDIPLLPQPRHERRNRPPARFANDITYESISFGVLHRAHLAHDDDLDLTGGTANSCSIFLLMLRASCMACHP